MSTEAIVTIVCAILGLIGMGLGAIVSLISIASVFVLVGRERQRLADLSRRHDELAKETRERLASMEHSNNAFGKWQSTVDATLSNIQTTLVELKTLLSLRAASSVSDALRRKKAS